MVSVISGDITCAIVLAVRSRKSSKVTLEYPNMMGDVPPSFAEEIFEIDA